MNLVFFFFNKSKYQFIILIDNETQKLLIECEIFYNKLNVILNINDSMI